MKRLSVLGSTGSIGVQTLQIVERFRDRFEVVALGAGRNIALMKEQIVRFRPRVVSVLSEEIAETLSRQVSEPVEILHGVEGLIRVATLDEATLVVSAVVGAMLRFSSTRLMPFLTTASSSTIRTCGICSEFFIGMISVAIWEEGFGTSCPDPEHFPRLWCHDGLPQPL